MLIYSGHSQNLSSRVRAPSVQQRASPAKFLSQRLPREKPTCFFFFFFLKSEQYFNEPMQTTQSTPGQEKEVCLEKKSSIAALKSVQILRRPA